MYLDRSDEPGRRSVNGKNRELFGEPLSEE